MNVLSLWVSKRVKELLDCSKTPFIPERIAFDETNGSHVTINFSDGKTLTVSRESAQCDCGSDPCKHLTKLYRRLSMKKPFSAKRLYCRLSCIIFEPDCPICLEPALHSNGKKGIQDSIEADVPPVIYGLQGVSMQDMFFCDSCSKAMHRQCCNTWRSSSLGKKWEGKCFICQNYLVEVVRAK